VVVVQANIAEGGHAHLGFKSGFFLRVFDPDVYAFRIFTTLTLLALLFSQRVSGSTFTQYRCATGGIDGLGYVYGVYPSR
jgi:hypothetical protein